MKQFDSSKLIESFGYEPSLQEFSAGDAWDTVKNVATSDMAKTAGAGAVAGKIASKALGRAVPGVGTALSWKDAYDRWQAGDRSGSVLSALAGAAYLVPGLGTAIGLGLDATNIGRDLASDDTPADEPNDTPPTNQLAQLQQIIGAKPDGIYGPETKQKLMAWQKEQGIKVDGIPGPETYKTAGLAESKGIEMKKTTETESIASIRDKLSIIENEELVNEAGSIDIIKGLSKAAANTGNTVQKAVSRLGSKDMQALSKAATGNTVQKAVSGLGPKEMQALSKAAANNPGLKYSEKYAIQKMGLLNWLKANPGKASLISGIAGTALGYALGGDGDNTSLSAQAAPSSKKSGDPEVMDRQRKLNDLGANIAVDGIWGPETEKAYQEYWVKNFAKHNALSTGASPEDAEKRQANWDIASKMGQPSQPIPGDVNAQIKQSELDKNVANLQADAKAKAEQAKKDQEEFAKKQAQSVAESIASIRDLLTSIENR